MNKLIALSVVAAFALSACASQPGPSQQKVFTNVYPYTRAGTVTAVMPAPGQVAPPPAPPLDTAPRDQDGQRGGSVRRHPKPRVHQAARASTSAEDKVIRRM